MVRQPKAYPVYDDDYEEQRRDDPRRSWTQKFPTLHLVGRNGMHKYNNQDHAMMTAMLCVKNIIAGATVYECGTSTRTPSITRPARPVFVRRWAAFASCRNVSALREVTGDEQHPDTARRRSAHD